MNDQQQPDIDQPPPMQQVSGETVIMVVADEVNMDTYEQDMFLYMTLDF